MRHRPRQTLRHKRRRLSAGWFRFIGRALAAIALYGVVSFSLSVVSLLATRPCETLSKPYAVAVVPGGDWTASRERDAIALVHKGLVETLYFTNADVTKRNRMTAVGMALAAGVPAQRIAFETSSSSTLQDAVFALRDLPGDAPIVVVTHGSHALRSKASFLLAGRHVAVCAVTTGATTFRRWRRILLRETAAWATNMPRAVLWGLARLVRADRWLPDVLLARRPAPVVVAVQVDAFATPASWR